MIKEPWDKRIDESDENYRQFLWWRDQIPRPVPSDLDVASYYDWSTRAAAWDAHCTVPSNLEDQIEGAVRGMGEVAILQTMRMLARARTSSGEELTIKEWATLVTGLVKIQAVMVDTIEKRRALTGVDSSEEERFAGALTPKEQSIFTDLLVKATKGA